MKAVAPCRESGDLGITNGIITFLFWKTACNIGLEKEARFFNSHRISAEGIFSRRFEVREPRTLGIS